MNMINSIRIRFTFPTILTIIRLIASPLLIPLVIHGAISSHQMKWYLLAIGIFLLLTITDFFDGYLARKWQTVSVLGAFLDPLADKFLLYSTLIILLMHHHVSIVVVLLLIGREFFILGLRQIAAQYHIKIIVSPWAKGKTVFQSLYLLLCILPDSMVIKIVHNGMFYKQVLMIVTVLLSISSAIHYYYIFYQKILRMEYEGDFR